MNLDITLLTDEQIWGDENRHGQLQVMRDYGLHTRPSDLAVLQGCLMHTREGEERTGYVWSASSYVNGYVRAVDGSGDWNYCHPSRRHCGARPALPSSTTSSIKASEASLPRSTILNGEVKIVQWGEYPQTIAPKEVAAALNVLSEEALEQKRTGKTYIFDGVPSNEWRQKFLPQPCPEYEHDDDEGNTHKYIRVRAQLPDDFYRLSNGEKPQENKSNWVEVQPVEWLVDPTGVWVARQALFAGVQLDDKPRYHGGFDEKDEQGRYKIAMKRYLMEHFARDIQPSLSRKEALRKTIHEWLHDDGAEDAIPHQSRYEEMMERAVSLNNTMATKWPKALCVDHVALLEQLLGVKGRQEGVVYHQYPKIVDTQWSERHCETWLETKWDAMRIEALRAQGLLAENGVDERALTPDEKKTLATEQRRAAALCLNMLRTPDSLSFKSDKWRDEGFELRGTKPELLDEKYRTFSDHISFLSQKYGFKPRKSQWEGADQVSFEEAVEGAADIVAEKVRQGMEQYRAHTEAGKDAITFDAYKTLPDPSRGMWLEVWEKLGEKYSLTQKNWPGPVAYPSMLKPRDTQLH